MLVSCPFPDMTTTNVSRHGQTPPGEEKPSWLRAIALNAVGMEAERGARKHMLEQDYLIYKQSAAMNILGCFCFSFYTFPLKHRRRKASRALKSDGVRGLLRNVLT